MTLSRPLLLSCALLCAAVALPAWAELSASSAASESSAASSGSVSESFHGSSHSSRGRRDLAAGDYRILEVAAAADRPGLVQLKLEALDEKVAADDLFLVLPQAAFDRGRLGKGVVITASARPYGFEFTAGQAQQAFFLVLHDDWHRELQSRPVVL